MVVGTGPELEKLRMLTAKLKADVTFLGYLTGEQLHEVVRGARAVVLPSEWYENAPMSVLEGYALGKPVIGARIGGIPELIRENETGLSFASGRRELRSPRRFATWQSGRTLRFEDMGKCARDWVEELFTARVYRDRILETYRELGVEARHFESQAPAMD